MYANSKNLFYSKSVYPKTDSIQSKSTKCFCPTRKNNTKGNVIIATAVATPVVIFGIYKALKRGKANEVIDTLAGATKEAPKFKNPDAEKRIITTLKPNDEGSLSIVKIAEHTKETTIQYDGENGFISRYIRKFGDTWKKLTPFISQEKVPVPSTTGMYLENGMNINRFLRSGDFYNHKFRTNRIPMEIPDNEFKAYTEMLIKEAKELNRQIIDSIDNLDIATHSSRTTKPMVVYRDAPIAWIDTAKDGKLIDRGYCSTSTERGASMEGMLSKEPTMTYEIELDENMPFLDLTYTTEKEMLLPRNLQFEIIGPNRLRCLGPISE